MSRHRASAAHLPRIWYNVIIIKHILVNYQLRNGKESRMKKMLMAFALCASMMLPGQDNPPEGIVRIDDAAWAGQSAGRDGHAFIPSDDI